MEECLETAKKVPQRRDLAENCLLTLLFGSDTLQTPSMAPVFVPNVDLYTNHVITTVSSRDATDKGLENANHGSKRALLARTTPVEPFFTHSTLGKVTNGSSAYRYNLGIPR